ncbi:MAG: 4Fe-4S dicluster domain-containing protein [Deltaproteobacteria bacterium]|nr:4Fe-4S dicluster domain-containing protein [Deltaproteobacteria bacterium]
MTPDRDAEIAGGEVQEPGASGTEKTVAEAPTAKPTRTKPVKKKRRRLSRQQQRRRSLLRSGLVGFALLLLQPIAHLPLARRAYARLRPPGAIDELGFLGACIKCGQCVQVCPVNAITFADIDEGLGSAAPFIDARAQACDFSCDALSCILACPTGALTHEIRTKQEVSSGVARLARPDACLARSGKGFRGTTRAPNFQGRLRYEEVDRWNAIPLVEHPYDREICDLCVIECPIGDTAIRLEALGDTETDTTGAMTPVVGDGCVGCGVCEMICPEEPTCIVVDPFGEEVRA